MDLGLGGPIGPVPDPGTLWLTALGILLLSLYPRVYAQWLSEPEQYASFHAGMGLKGAMVASIPNGDISLTLVESGCEFKCSPLCIEKKAANGSAHLCLISNWPKATEGLHSGSYPTVRYSPKG